MPGEQLLYRALETEPIAITALRITSAIHVAKHHSVIEGYPLPKKGGAFIVGNHRAKADSYMTCEAARRAGRAVRPVVKMSLIVEGAHESPEFLQAIGDKADPLEYDPIKAAVMRGVGAVGLFRDNPTRDFIRQTKALAASDEIFGMFFQNTRDEEGFLRNLKPGPAFYIRRNPKKPIHLAAFSDEHVTFLEPTSYNQMCSETGRILTNGETIIIMADKIAPALPERAQDHWEQRRPEEVKLLIPKKRRLAFPI